MNLSKIENFQPEPQPNNEQKPMNSTSTPAIGNTNVVRSFRQYKVIYVSGIATKIGFEKSPNYYECVFETIYPTDEEIDKMSDKQQGLWTDENNSRMESICKFLNSKI